MMKGIYRPLSNFEFMMKVEAIKSCSTGFMIYVTPEHISSNDQNNATQQEEILSWYVFVVFGYSTVNLEVY